MQEHMDKQEAFNGLFTLSVVNDSSTQSRKARKNHYKLSNMDVNTTKLKILTRKSVTNVSHSTEGNAFHKVTCGYQLMLFRSAN